MKTKTKTKITFVVVADSYSLPKYGISLLSCCSKKNIVHKVITKIEEIDNLSPEDLHLIYCISISKNGKDIFSKIKADIPCIFYSAGANRSILNNKFLSKFSLKYIKIDSKTSSTLINEQIGDFPYMLHMPGKSNAAGKTIITNLKSLKSILKCIDRPHYIMPYYEHNFHIRIFVVNRVPVGSLVYHKYENEFATNYSPSEHRKSMVFSTSINPLLEEMSVEYAKIQEFDTFAMDVLVTIDNEYYLMESNFPFVYDMLEEKNMNFISGAIVDGLIEKSKIFDKLTDISFKEINFVIKDAQKNNVVKLINFVESSTDVRIPIVTDIYSYTSDKNFMYFNNPSFNPKINSEQANKFFGFNDLTKKINSCPEFKILIPIKGARKISDLELDKRSITFPMILKLKKENSATLLKINKKIEAASTINYFVGKGYKYELIKYFYPTKKRRVYAVADEIVAAKEFYFCSSDAVSIFSTSESFYININDISNCEVQAIHAASKQNKYESFWFVDYYISIDNIIYIKNFQTGYDINNCSIKHIINSIIVAYKRCKQGTIVSYLRNRILNVKDVYQRLNLLFALNNNLKIFAINNSLEEAILSDGNVSHKIKNCWFSEKLVPLSSAKVADDKNKFQLFMSEKYSHMIPKTICIDSEKHFSKSMLKDVISDLKYPFIIKPSQSIMSIGMHPNVKSIDEAYNVINQLKLSFDKILIQEQVKGKEYRVLIVNGELVAAVEKIPATIIGNGINTIEELIEEYNNYSYSKYKNIYLEQLEHPANKGVITPRDLENLYIKTPNIGNDPRIKTFFDKSGHCMTDVLPYGKKITLPFIRTGIGATMADRTNSISPIMVDMLKEILLEMGLGIGGIDVICEGDSFKVIEVNPFPAINTHHFVHHGAPQPAMQKILSALFPQSYKETI